MAVSEKREREREREREGKRKRKREIGQNLTVPNGSFS